MSLAILHARTASPSELEALFQRSIFAGTEEAARVALEIVEAVRQEGDEAVLRYARRFDCPTLTVEQFRVTPEEMEEAERAVEPRFRSALEKAIENLTDFHRRQVRQSWMEVRPNGAIVGQRFLPLERVGLYMPGGSAPLPSSILALGVPARVAGVKELVLCTPCGPDGRMKNPHTLVAARALGIEEVYRIGGAQAIAAMAFGTQTIRRVDKVCGPGNPYVLHAKRLVYGYVGIDSLAGPTEVLVVADETARPEHVAADLLAQAEHAPEARPLCITTSLDLAEAVRQEVERQLAALPRAPIAREALRRGGAILVVESLEEAAEWVNRMAPEHLELLVASPWPWLAHIRHAGAIFLGEDSPEPVGDYIAGPSHVLPTGGTARFASPVTVDDFLKTSSLIAYSRRALQEEAEAIVALAEVEGLTAHAEAVRKRLE